MGESKIKFLDNKGPEKWEKVRINGWVYKKEVREKK